MRPLPKSISRPLDEDCLQQSGIPDPTAQEAARRSAQDETHCTDSWQNCLVGPKPYQQCSLIMRPLPYFGQDQKTYLAKVWRDSKSSSRNKDPQDPWRQSTIGSAPI